MNKEMTQEERVLSETIRRNNIEGLRKMLDAGVSACVKNEALRRAAYWDDADKVELLVANGAEVDAQDEYGYTPLMQAIGENNPNIVRLLLERDADVNVKAVDGDTALIMAARSNRTEIAELLEDHINKKKYMTKEEGLFKAIFNNNVEELRRILDDGADVNARNSGGSPLEDGYPALICAAARGNTSMVLLLLKHGADVDARDKQGRNAAIHAAYNSHAEVVELLQYHKAIAYS